MAPSRDDFNEKVIAFVFGVIAHQEADVPWHWNHPDCNDPNASEIGWGVECEALVNYSCSGATCELMIDNYLYHYDSPENVVYFDFFPTASATVYLAVDNAGIRRPDHVLLCGLVDPLQCGHDRIMAGWAVATSDGGANDGYRDMVVNHVPGGIEYGSALTAAAWMNTWIQVGQHHELFLPLLTIH